MDNSEWQDLHNDNGDSSDKVRQTVEIDWGADEFYECFAEVQLFNGIPCEVEIVGMIRHDSGAVLDRIELDYEEFPYYITLAAEKKILEML